MPDNRHSTISNQWQWTTATTDIHNRQPTYSNQRKYKDKIPKFRNKYSQKRNIGASVPISTFMRLWAFYIIPWSVSLFCWRKYVYRSWDCIKRSQTHECWNWGWGRAIPRKGIYKSDSPCSAVCHQAALNNEQTKVTNLPLAVDTDQWQWLSCSPFSFHSNVLWSWPRQWETDNAMHFLMMRWLHRVTWIRQRKCRQRIFCQPI